MQSKKLRYNYIFLFLGIINFLFFSKGVGADMDSFVVHYFRFDGDYKDWTLWTWNAVNHQTTKEINKEVTSSGQDADGLKFVVQKNDYAGATDIGVLPKYHNWDSKDGPDRVYSSTMGNEVWIIQGDPHLFTNKPDVRPSIQAAFLDSTTQITLVLSKSLNQNELVPAHFSVTDETGKRVEIKNIDFIPVTSVHSRTVQVTLEKPLDIAHNHISEYGIALTGFRPGTLTLRKILDSSEFYFNIPLGAIYSPTKTVFRVFSPIASAITLVIYDQPVGGNGKEYKMKYSQHGIWEYSVSGDLQNKYYTLKAEGPDKRFNASRELIDPYSKCNTAYNGRGMIIDDKTPVTARPEFDISQAMIYELHIRDIDIDNNSGVKNKGKYIGLTETGTTIPGKPDIKTALDHIVELGVNVVQIMPFQQFEHVESRDDYNWGYMPVHFNSPDGWFATDRLSAKRVEEVKRMIDALHKKGIKVIMDVVYNHTAENDAGHVFSFNGLVPGYYYRLKDDGTLWNGSGTGNEFRSEAPMARKFLLDSLKYWVTEYKVDGFRFDLLGLIDLKTVEDAAKELHAIDPDIFIYGEPWAAGNTQAKITGKGSQKGKGFSVFNDNFRNAFKGSVFGTEKGYVQNGSYLGAMKKGIIGSITDFTDSPTETINYIECHDNHTFWDRLLLTTKGDNAITDADRIAMDKLGAAILFTSQGVPFIQAGQEFLRTKGGEENSYNKPDSVNEINWQEKIDHADVFKYYQGLIQIRKNHPLFRFKTKQDVLDNVKFLDDDLKLSLPDNCLGYKITKGNSGDSWNEVVVLANPNPQKMILPIPEGNWIVVANAEEAGDRPVRSGTATIKGNQADVAPRSVLILYR